MLQRIQSIYLALAAIISTVFFFIPISTIEVNDNTYAVKASGIYYQDMGNYVFDSPLLALSSVLVFHIILSLMTIFLFNNRSRQITLCNLNLVLLVICMILVFFYAGDVPEKPIDEAVKTVTYSYGGLIPMMPVVLVLLARKAIKKDENLVKSVDRLR
ncbi:MAG: hypothetical protein CL840_17930 [Crocinitomicaceae bacterium]|nr:hypothetical protein [Crocinitomicaceae bacterium]|tara:strand:+ start:9536 stop:10009 length:474 start_codon:yes stop_codon:yes gene_type:complete